MIDLSTLQSEAQSLAPLPQSATRLASLLVGDSWNIEHICEVVRLDEALTGRLLGFANSVRGGSRDTIGTVEAAVMRLGSGTVLGLALTGSLHREYQRPLPAYGLDEGGLWRHSVAAALAVEESRRFCKRTIPVEAFATALLHDVGKLVLARHLTDEVLETLHAVRGDTSIDAVLEKTVAELDHAELGGIVATSWGLPSSIVAAITHHEAPLDAPDDQGRVLSSIVGLADAVAVRAGAPCGGPEPDPDFTPAVAGSVGLRADGFVQLVEAVALRLEDVLAQYG